MMITSFSVMLDACSLVPITLCDTLLSLADRRLYRPLWSPIILDETERNVAKMIEREGKTQAFAWAAASSRRLFMEGSYPEASVMKFEQLIPSMTNHAKDRHVLAAAVRGSAQIIVTNNVVDFPQASLAPYDIELKTPDDFLIDLLGHDTNLVIETIHDMAAAKTRPPLSFTDMLNRISKNAPNFSASVELHMR